MTAWRLILRSLVYYRRTHLGVALGYAIGAAVLAGALLVGDSVRASLREMALARIGGVDAALVSNERFFRDALADELAADSNLQCAPVLSLAALASAGGGARRARDVVVLGVDERFFALAPEPWSGTEGLLLGERLANQLEVRPGDTVVLRVEEPSALPRDMVLATGDDGTRALRLEVEAVLADGAFGRFGLQASQVPPFNAFLPLRRLQEELDLAGRANLLLCAGGDERAEVVEKADSALNAHWTLDDGELALRESPSTVELASRRVFLDAPVEDACRTLDRPLVGVLTYFVNELRVGARATPYSMVTAIGFLGAPDGPSAAALEALLPDDLGPDEIVVNEWLADDLQAQAGDDLALRYFVPGPDRRLTEETRTFRVRAVVPIAGLAGDASLMPDFPGLADSENCRDWETGMPIDLDAIRDKDEAYWDEHRGTPKAFVSLAAGQAMWANRFGALTAVRADSVSARDLEAALHGTLAPASLGLFFRDVRTPALAASSSATDFGGLFLGLSFFLIVAALLLTALLFVFGIEQRASEIGILLALGHPPAFVRRLFFGEAAVLAFVGSAVGAALGTFYTRAVLYGLATVWSDAVATTALTYHGRPATVALGMAATFAVALGASAFALRSQVRHSALELLGAREGVTPEAAEPKRSRVSLVVGVLALLAALAVAGVSDPRRGAAAAGAFFGAGAALLVAGLAFSRHVLSRVGGARDEPPRSVGRLGLANGGRRPGRSLATVALLASGTFLVVSIGAHEKSGAVDSASRAAGTGGFALIGRSTLGLGHDLGAPDAREAYGLTDQQVAGVSVVSMRVREGDDASCLNLGSPQTPRLVGVKPETLAQRGAFSFVDRGGVPATGSPWSLLAGTAADGALPAIADQASVTWTLHKQVGDVLDYVDERGRPFQVRLVATLAGSILQGDVFIAERAFQEKYPSESGYRMFLVDAPEGRAAEVATALSRALPEVGLELVPTARRLDEFHAVQNTYLDIFQLLGGLGVLLGSVGLGVVVLRNALERRRELAVVAALGYPRRALRWLLFSEHSLLLALGLGTGAISALVALVPVARAAVSEAPFAAVAPLLGLIVANGVLWVWLASVFVVRKTPVAALREE